MKRVYRGLWYLLFFLLPFQTRYFLWSASLSGSFYEYGSIALYAWEVVALILCLWGLWKRPLERKTLGVFLVFGFALIWSCVFSVDVGVSVRHLVFLMEAVLLAWLSRDVFSPKILIRILFVSVLVQLVWGLWQFFVGGSMGSSLLGVASRDAGVLGDSVVLFEGTRYLRAYGLMSHPNVLGGFLVVVIVFVLSWGRFFSKMWMSWVLGISSVCLFFTFSRSAWIALCLAVFLFWRKEAYLQKMLLFWIVIPFVFLSCLFSSFLISRLEVDNRLEQKSVQERLSSWSGVLQVLPGFWWQGTGMGNYTRVLWQENSLLPVWSYQPVHMAYVLFVLECGVFLSILLGYVGYRLFLRWQPIEIWLPLVVLGLFDHYLWTIPFFLVYIGVIFSLKSPK